jgi:signal peptidase II
MPKTMPESTPSHSHLSLKLVLLIVGLYLIDQVTKLLIVWKFDAPSYQGILGQPETHRYVVDTVPVIDNFLNIVRIHNTGVAFGMGNGTAWSSYVFLAVPVLACAILIYMFRKGFFSTTVLRVAWALLIAGILGNLTDRLIQGFIYNAQYAHSQLKFAACILSGYVVDFIDVTIPFINYRWPAFNIADSCICIAAALFIISSFKSSSGQQEVAQ